MTVAHFIGAKAPRDLALARQCTSGDRAAQKHLFADYKALIHNILFRILGSNREIEDLVQDSFLEVFRSLRNYRGEAKLSTWIARITTRVAFAHISRRKPSAATLDSVPALEADAPGADAHTGAREAARRLYGALERLDGKYRVPFALHVIDGRSLKEVAEITESSLVATKSRVWRARREIFKRARRDPLLAEYLIEQGVER